MSVDFFHPIVHCKVCERYKKTCVLLLSCADSMCNNPSYTTTEPHQTTPGSGLECYYGIQGGHDHHDTNLTTQVGNATNLTRQVENATNLPTQVANANNLTTSLTIQVLNATNLTMQVVKANQAHHTGSKVHQTHHTGNKRRLSHNAVS